MEPGVAIAIAIRPVAVPIFFFVAVAPIAWLLYRVFPPGRLKVILFRQRTGAQASRRDQWVIGIAAVIAEAAFLAWIVYLSSGMWP